MGNSLFDSLDAERDPNQVFDYQADLDIDAYNLEEECVKQPTTYMKYAVEMVRARKTLEQAKRRVKVVRAEVEKEVREEPDLFGIDKITNPAVEAAVNGDARVGEAENDVIAAQADYSLLSSAVEAMSQRKSMIEELGRLQLAGYYSDPKVNNDALQEKASEDSHRKTLNTSRLKKKRTRKDT